MTYHSSFDWQFGNPVTEELVDEVVCGLEDTRCYNEGEGRTGYMNCTYSVLSAVDEVIYNVGSFLDGHDVSPITEEDIEKYFGNSNPPPGVMELVRKVLSKMSNDQL